jgi:prephenate dehydrogenase
VTDRRPLTGVVGLGLIGGSVFRRLAATRDARVLGFDGDATLEDGANRVGKWCPSVDELVRACDVLVLCVPVPAIVRLLPAIAAACATRGRRRRLLVTDMGSMKAPVARAAVRYAPDFDYVGLHPLAGGEVNGWAASDAALFERRTMVYCPGTPAATRLAVSLIEELGAVAVKMAPADHDRMAAETIGLPHLLAFAAASLRPPANAPHPLRGTSWGGLTRVSVSDPTFVAGLLHSNARNQLRVVRVFQRRLDRLARLVAAGDEAALARALRRSAKG